MDSTAQHFAPTPPRQRGFTLVESMTTVAILAILMGVGLPSLRDLQANQRMRVASHSLIASFQQARMRALAQAGQIIVCPSLDGRRCSGGLDWQHGWIIYDDRNRNRQLDADETVSLSHSRLPDGVNGRATIGRPQMIYRADGSANGNPITVTLCDDRGWRHGRSIVVNQGGRARTGPASNDRCPV